MKVNSRVVVTRMVVFLACVLPCFADLLPPATCNEIKKVRIVYRNYYDLYMGNNVFLPQLRMDGVHVQVLQKAIKMCCQSTELDFIFDSSKTLDIEEEVMQFLMKDHSGGGTTYTFYYPEFADKKVRQIYDTQMQFVTLARSPGHAIVMKKPAPIPAVFVGEIFVKSWAILIFLITFAWIIGILGWMSDHNVNPVQFPNPFYRGMFEGFWWSIVTMTTVGYGDMSPKGGLGRVLAVIWIMISTVFLSLFTANATSILQISQAEEDHSLTLGKMLGVLNSKHFVERELNLGAQTIEFYDSLSLMMALDQGVVNRLVFPNYIDFLIFTSFPEYESVKDQYQLTNVLDHPFQIGVVMARISSNLSTTDQMLLTCMRSIISGLEKKERGNFDISAIAWDAKTKKKLKTALDSDSLLTMTYYFFYIIAVLLMFGFCWDGWKYYKKKRPQRQAADIEMDSNPIATDEIYDLPSREPTPTMQEWEADVSSKYQPSNSENASPNKQLQESGSLHLN